MTDNIAAVAVPKLDFVASFDADKCASLVAEVADEFGLRLDDVVRRKVGGEPEKTLRQVARVVAVEAGFAPRCVAAACGCTEGAVRQAAQALDRRAKSKAGAALAPVLERARQAAGRWSEG
jgi:hypothetical protein